MPRFAGRRLASPLARGGASPARSAGAEAARAAVAAGEAPSRPSERSFLVLPAVHGATGLSASPGMSYKSHVEWFCPPGIPQALLGEETACSVLIPVAEIVEAIQLQVVVVHQVELVVPVVDWLAAPHHGHHPFCPRVQCRNDRHSGEPERLVGAVPSRWDGTGRTYRLHGP